MDTINCIAQMVHDECERVVQVNQLVEIPNAHPMCPIETSIGRAHTEIMSTERKAVVNVFEPNRLYTVPEKYAPTSEHTSSCFSNRLFANRYFWYLTLDKNTSSKGRDSSFAFGQTLRTSIRLWSDALSSSGSTRMTEIKRSRKMYAKITARPAQTAFFLSDAIRRPTMRRMTIAGSLIQTSSGVVAFQPACTCKRVDIGKPGEFL